MAIINPWMVWPEERPLGIYIADERVPFDFGHVEVIAMVDGRLFVDNKLVERREDGFYVDGHEVSSISSSASFPLLAKARTWIVTNPRMSKCACIGVLATLVLALTCKS